MATPFSSDETLILNLGCVVCWGALWRRRGVLELCAHPYFSQLISLSSWYVIITFWLTVDYIQMQHQSMVYIELPGLLLMTLMIPFLNLLNTLYLRIWTIIFILSSEKLRYEVVILISQRSGSSVRVLFWFCISSFLLFHGYLFMRKLLKI